MKISATRNIAGSKVSKIILPNLAVSENLIPEEISVYEISKGERKPLKGVNVSIYNNNTVVFTFQQAYFEMTNMLDLSERKNVFSDGKDFSLTITNLTTDVKTVYVEVKYEKNYGNIIYQNSYTDFGRVMEEVHANGNCTRLHLIFDQHFEEGSFPKLIPSVDRVDEEDVEWLSTVDFQDPEITEHGSSYVIDFVEKLENGETFKLYSDYLNLLRLDVPKIVNEDGREVDIKLYVVAYGYPK